MKKNARLKYKIFAFISIFALLFSLCSISTFAWHYNNDGNIVSDNVQPINDVQQNVDYGITWSIENQILKLNGTSNGGFWYTLPNSSFTLYAGTYTIQWFTNYNGTDIGFGLRNSDSSLSELYQINSNKYKTFTISRETTFNIVVWWSSSGLTFNNIEVGSMVYAGSYDLDTDYEPYGLIYYASQNITPVSQFYYTNLSKAYLNWYVDVDTSYNLGFTRNGVFGSVESYDDLDWNLFETNSAWQESFNNINSPYGYFYNTTWNIYNFIQEFGSVIYVYQDKPIVLTYEFITPQVFDTYFDISNFSTVNLYDFNGNLIFSDTGNRYVYVNYSNVFKVELIRSDSDIATDGLYCITDLTYSFYNNGYLDGYNAGRASMNGAYQNGYSAGVQEAEINFNNGIYPNSNSYIAGYDAGHSAGADESYNAGYSAGYAKARADTTWIDNSTANASDLIWTIGATPWESFKNIWNINFLGINLANLVTGFITAIILLWIIKRFWK